MTTALKRAFDVASRLSDAEQDSLAAAILEEIAVDRRWEATLTANRDALERLADEALAEHAAGRTETLDPEKLRGRAPRSGFAPRLPTFQRWFETPGSPARSPTRPD